MATQKQSTAPSADAVRDKVMDFLNDDPEPDTTTQQVPPDTGVDEGTKPPATQEPPATPPPETKVDDDLGIPNDILGTPTATETTVVEDSEPPPPPEVSKDPKAAHAWQTVRTENKELKARIAELEAAASSVKQADPEEITKLRGQLEEYEQKLGQYDLTATREFQQKYDAPTQHIRRRVQQMLQRGGKDETAAQVLTQKLANPSLSLDQIQDLLADEPLSVQGAILNMVTELADIEASKAEAVKNWKETKAALKVQSQQAQELKLAEDIDKATQEAHAEAIKAGNFMLAPSQDENWNRQVAERVLAAKGIIRTAKPADLIKYVMEGITAAQTRDMLRSAHALAEKRKAELDKVLKTAPRIGADGTTDTAPRERKPISPEQMVNDLFADAPPMVLR